MSDHDRHGAKHPHRFNPERAAILDDVERFTYVPPQTLLDALAPPPHGTLLDFGAGTGLYAVALARLRPDLHVLALDDQEAMLERLRATVAAAAVDNVTVLDPIASRAWRGRIDRMLVLNVLHHLGDADLVDLRALLAPDGRAVFVDWNADVERPMGPARDHVYGAAEAEARLTDAGFVTAARATLAYHHVLSVRGPSPSQR